MKATQWFSLLLLGMKIIGWWVEWGKKRKWINEGRKKQLADELIAVAKQAKAAKSIREKVEELSDEELVDELTS